MGAPAWTDRARGAHLKSAEVVIWHLVTMAVEPLSSAVIGTGLANEGGDPRCYDSTMARYARNLLVLFGPPALVAWPLLRQYVAGTAGSDRDVHVVSVTAHLAAAMLILAALAMSVRLRWAADRALLAAQTVFWMDVAAAWGLTCAAATTMIVNWLSAFDAFWGLSIVMIFANVLSAALLAFMIRRAEQGKARPRPWTMFA